MRSRLLPLLLAPALWLGGSSFAMAAEPAAYAQREAEIRTLKARVLELEAQLAGRLPAPLSPTPGVAMPTDGVAADISPLTASPTSEGPNKITRKVVVVEEEAHSSTGCSRGLFKGPPPGRWLDKNAWDELDRDMSAAEVERLLGVEHYNVGTGSRVIWQYGKCGPQVRGEVLLVNGRVEQWRAPVF